MMITSDKYKRIFVLCSMFFVVTACNESNAQSEYEKNLEKLEQVCADETNNDLDGKVFESLIGKYVRKDSYTASEHGGDSLPRYSYQITFLNAGNKTTVFSKTMSEKVYKEEHQPIMKNIFDRPDNQDRIYGICIYQEDDKYIGAISTLRKLGE